MTREEIKTNIRQGLTCYDERDDDLIVLIDEIYDDFESRRCESCEYYKAGSLAYFCNNIDSQSTHYEMTEVSFGCNKWRANDNKH